jgi:hypothetical protein
MNECCVVLFANADFAHISNCSINTSIKSELISKAFPKGSNWRLFAGARSLAIFPFDNSTNIFSLCYSVITDSIDVPVISFVIISTEYGIQRILNRQETGIQSAYFRRMGIFENLDKRAANLLAGNLISLRISENRPYVSGKPLKITESFQNSSQWRDNVEKPIIQVASKNLTQPLTFRTLSLKPDNTFQAIGIIKN